MWNKPQKATPKAEVEGGGRFRLVDERCIVQLEPLEGLLQQRIILTVTGV